MLDLALRAHIIGIVHRNKAVETAPGRSQAGIDFNVLFTRRFTMFQAPEQFMALNKANLEAAVRFAGIALEGAERMLELQLKTAKSAFADGVQQAKAFTEIKDVQELAQLKNTIAQPAIEKATSYVKSIYDVATATQSEIN